MNMIKFLLDREEPSSEQIRQRMDFESIYGGVKYQKWIMNPWVYVLGGVFTALIWF
jgi:hypothetical protein